MKKGVKKTLALLLVCAIVFGSTPFEGLSGFQLSSWLSFDASADTRESDIENITVVATKPLIENADGNTINFNPETGENSLEYFRYDYENNLQITVEYKDGTEISGSCWQTYDQSGHWVDFTDDQSYENQWGVGTHTVTATFMDVSTQFEVEVIENPIESISVVTTTLLIENADGYTYAEYNPETDEYDLEYFRYDYEINLQITVEYKDGTVISGDYWQIYDKSGYWVHFTDDQSCENQWGVGTHTVTATFMDVSTQFEVEVIENPIESISVVTTTLLIENADGYTYAEYNPETDEYDLEYFRYDYEINLQITVEYKDGTVISGDYWQIYDKSGYWVHFTDDQSCENQWGVGTHTVTATFMGVSTQFEVEVIENPIESISVVATKPLIENADGNTINFNPETGENSLEYFRYDYENNLQITVEYKDGTVISGDYWQIYDQSGYGVAFVDDQSYENQWGVGTHTATATFMGVSTQFEVEVIESPIESIFIVTTGPLIENVDGSTNTEYNPETDEYDLEFFQYSYHINLQITVEYKDGTVISGDYWQIYDKSGYWVHFTDDQSCENQWGVGTHTATATFMGVSTQFEVEVIESPIESIFIVTTGPLIENVDGSTNTEYNPETDEYDLDFFQYSYHINLQITVEYKDGTVISGDYWQIYDKSGYWVHFTDDQSCENQWGVGTHTATATFMGVSTQLEVEVIENSYKSVTISETESLIITVEKYSGETIVMEAQSFKPRCGDEGMVGGTLFTDKGQYTVEFRFDFDENQNLYNQNLKLNIFGLTSNTLDSCSWLQSTTSFDLNGGTGTAPTDITDVIGKEVALPEQGDITREGYLFLGWAESAGATQALENYYTIPVDDTILYAVWESEIDPEIVAVEGSDAVIDNEKGFIYGLKTGITLAEISDYITCTGDTSIEVEVNATLGIGTGSMVTLIDNTTQEVIASYYIVIFGDVDGDGNITTGDTTKLLQYVAKIIDAQEGSPYVFAANLDGFGDITSNDATKLNSVVGRLSTIDQTTGLTTTTTTAPIISNGSFVFTTRGYGHGVGMSQEGAIAYSKMNWTYDDILLHYYPGTTIKTDSSVPDTIRFGTNEIDTKEYLSKVARQEIGSPNFSTMESFKSQVVAIYTYAKYYNYNVSESQHAYYPYEIDNDLVYQAVDEVLGKYVDYNGSAALTTYSASCAGKTASAKTTWGGTQYPYLCGGVESSENVRVSSKMLTTDQINYYIENFEGADIELSDNPNEWFEILSSDSTGYVEKIRVGNYVVSGNTFRSNILKFSILSHCFVFEYNQD